MNTTPHQPSTINHQPSPRHPCRLCMRLNAVHEEHQLCAQCENLNHYAKTQLVLSRNLLHQVNQTNMLLAGILQRMDAAQEKKIVLAVPKA